MPSRLYQFSASSLFLIFLAACAADPSASGSLYTYVDAQGNLVTVERSASPPASPDGASREDGGDDNAVYQTDEQVQAGLESRDRNRFVTFMGPDGQLIEQRVDLIAERQNKEAAAPRFEALDQTSEYIERIVGVRADCCAHTRAQAMPLGLGQQVSLPIRDAEEAVLLGRPMPALALRLSAGVESVVLRSYISGNQSYQHPGVVFMNGLGVPLAVIDRPFQRRFPENWYRYAFFEGQLPVPDGARYVAFYLPYAVLEPPLGVTIVPELRARYEVPPTLAGELTVTGAARLP